MNPALRPVNKQAALFSRRPRMTKLDEALEVFAARITSPESLTAIKALLEQPNTTAQLKLVIYKHNDGTGRYGCSPSTTAKTDFDHTNFGGLE
jgi:hypothetical protein